MKRLVKNAKENRSGGPVFFKNISLNYSKFINFVPVRSF